MAATAEAIQAVVGESAEVAGGAAVVVDGAQAVVHVGGLVGVHFIRNPSRQLTLTFLGGHRIYEARTAGLFNFWCCSGAIRGVL